MAAERLAAAARIGRFNVAALLQGGRLEDLRLDDPESAAPRPGEVWAARVDRLAPSQGAAFLDLGAEPAYLPDAAGLSPGDRVLVEIQRWPEARKAAQASRKLTIRGELMAHTPTAPGVNLSRRIVDQTLRARLSEAMAGFAEAGGFVLRTAAATAAEAAVRDEAGALAAEAARLAAEPLDPPRRLRAAPDPLAQLVWDWKPTRRMGGFDSLEDGAGLFDSLGLFEAMEALCAPRVELAEGWMSFDRTEALVAIDVNTGAPSAASALRVNLAAAAEIPRQLRLRGWGGMVLVDFAPASAADRGKIEQALRRAGDSELKLAGWGPLGLMEARRRRDRPPLETLWPRRESESR